MIREQFRRFAEEQIAPYAHGWHAARRADPARGDRALAELGVFGLTVPEDWGGLGLGKAAMCVVTEELSRGYIGVGSLGTRSEIAAELIRLAGTDAQKASYLPRIASGEIIPTAVFTEPNTGSDLASLQTRAVREGEQLSGDRGQDLDHPRRARRPDDHPVPHRPGRAGLSRPVDPAGREAARQRRRAVPGRRPVGQRDPGARLSRHEGVHAVLRRLRGAARRPARRHRGPGLQAADGDLRVGAHPDRGARGRRRAQRARAGAGLRQGADPVRQADPARFRASPTSWSGWRSRS